MAHAVDCIPRNPYCAHLNAPLACAVCAVWREATERPPQKRPVDAGTPYQPDERASEGSAKCRKDLRRPSLARRPRWADLEMAAYRAIHAAHWNAPQACAVCGVCTPHGVAWRGCAGYCWLAGRTVSRVRILFGTSAAPRRDFARQFPPKPAPAAIRAPAPDRTGLTRSNEASPTRENTSFVHAQRAVAHTCGTATAKRSVRGARFGVPSGPECEPDQSTQTSCSLQVVSWRSQLDSPSRTAGSTSILSMASGTKAARKPAILCHFVPPSVVLFSRTVGTSVPANFLIYTNSLLDMAF